MRPEGGWGEGEKGSSCSTLKGSRFLQNTKIWQIWYFYGQVTVPRIFIIVLYFFVRVLHCLKKEMKGERVNSPYRLYSVGDPSLGSEIPEGSSNSQSCDADFAHVNIPSGLTRNYIFHENYYATRAIKGVFHLQKNSEIFHWEFPFGKARSICHKSHSGEAWPLNRPQKAWNWW